MLDPLEVHLLDFPNIVITGSELQLPFQVGHGARLAVLLAGRPLRCHAVGLGEGGRGDHCVGSMLTAFGLLRYHQLCRPR